MKIFFSLFCLCLAVFAFQNQKGKIDMHGGKYQNYGGFSKMQDMNATNFQNKN